MKKSDVDKIERYINSLSDDNEKQWVDSLFLTGEENSILRHFLEKDWNLLQQDNSGSDVDLSHLLDKVHHIIWKKEIEKKHKPLYKIMRFYMKAAAVLLLPVLITGGLVYSYIGRTVPTLPEVQVSTSIYSPMGARVSFNLPDGTKGMLNSGSHLSYSLPFNNNRIVNLEGEAWFDVSHDENHPFKIYTGNSTVKALGTSFNLSAYPVENYVELVLKEGKVEFRNNKSDKKVTMLSSERLIFKDGKISQSVVDPAKYNAWTAGKLVFRGDSMVEVGRRLERWYNVEFELADKELEKYSFRGTFEDDKIEEVLRLLSMTSPITFKITDRKLMGDGTYEKEKVTIYMKK